jgi:hypothetical protein
MDRTQRHNTARDWIAVQNEMGLNGQFRAATHKTYVGSVLSGPHVVYQSSIVSLSSNVTYLTTIQVFYMHS